VTVKLLRLWRAGPLAAFLAITTTLTLLVVFGHEGRRVGQVLLLALPGLAWLFWPLRTARMKTVRAVALWLWSMAFVVDASLRAYLFDTYEAAPDSSLVLSAMANTAPRESAQYLSMHWRSLVAACLPMLGAGALLVVFVLPIGGAPASRGEPVGAPVSAWPRWPTLLLCVGLLASSVAYASKPWRRLHPVLYWVGWNHSMQGLRAAWADNEAMRRTLLDRAQAAAPVLRSQAPATLVLVISDSVNRDNLGLYGYPRATTPRLSAQRAGLSEQLVVLRHAWSVDPATVPALANLFQFGDPAAAQPMHVLALARAAGYRVWWISNHDDVAIEQSHGRLADELRVVSRTPGRSSESPDTDVLEPVRAALADSAAHKLVVVHLMGAHPHYSLRYPNENNVFEDDGQIDTVERRLENEGRPAWLRQRRNEYDAALLHHDTLVSELLDLTRASGASADHKTWMFLSDHGQEVGHERNHAGHSPGTAAGYRIPALIWRNDTAKPLPTGLETRPFRADWAGWTLTDLLGIRWSADAPERNVLADAYRWQAPRLRAPVASFVD
jgi:heptose-I-phosphate ethanolaminephosphotransferase